MHKKQVEPLVWGAWGGIAGGVIAGIAAGLGELGTGGTALGYAGGGFFWAWAVANIRNWLATREP